MGELYAIKVLTTLMKQHELPEGTKVTWNESEAEQVIKAEEIFQKYLKEGWLAFGEDAKGKKQIFKFDPALPRIILMPPIGGG